MNLDSKANADGEEWEENTKPMVTLTHCGKLGDFVYTWPIAAWFWRTMGRRGALGVAAGVRAVSGGGVFVVVAGVHGGGDAGGLPSAGLWVRGAAVSV